MEFRPGSVEMMVVGAFTLLGACFAAWMASGLRVVGSDTPQLLLAIAGLIPALGTLIESVRRRGHPGIWFCATALIYSIWGVYVWRQFNG